MQKYPAAVSCLLQSYAIDHVVESAVKNFQTSGQLPTGTEEAFATRLERYSAEGGNLFSEDATVSVYVAGLHCFAANLFRGQMSPSMNFAQVRNLKIQAGKAGRSRSSLRAPITGLSPVRPRALAEKVVDSP
jgi:hypothetical protein